MKAILLTGLLFLTAIHAAIPNELDAAETSALLRKLTDARAGKGLTARFEEKKILPMMTEPIFEHGTIAFEPPGKFLRRTQDGNLAVSNGTTLWMYYPAFSQVEQYPLDKGGGPGALFSMLTQIFELKDVERQFRATATRTPDGYQLHLLPRSGSLRKMIGEVTLELDRSLRLRSTKLVGSAGDRIETSYSDEKVVPAGSTDFEFTPAPGATVVKPLGR